MQNRYFLQVIRLFFLTALFSVSFVQAGQVVSPEQIQGADLFTGEKVTVNFSNMHGGKIKGYVLVFVSAVCPCSNSHIPELQKLAEEYKEYQFIAIHSNVNEALELTSVYFKKANLTFPVINDPEAKIADLYRAHKTPHAFVLNSQGKIVYQGGVTSSALADQADVHYLKDALSDLKKQQPVKVAFGRTLGCVISRSKD